jgi:ketosteroid isomerase-like protein
MSTKDNKQIVTEFFEAGDRGDVVHWSSHGRTKFSGPCIGKQALGEELMGPLFGSLKNGPYTRIDCLIAEGEVVVMEASGQSETHDGTPYNNKYCMVIEARDGRIQKVVEYTDTALVNEIFGR